MAFVESRDDAVDHLKGLFPKADYHNSFDQIQQKAIRILAGEPDPVKLHIKGTDFQLKVWETLLRIPMGQLATYGDVAGLIDNPSSSRAVGSAIGENPVAFLIPCHRVIQSTGAFGQYRWGSARKTAMIGWENALVSKATATP